MRCHSPLDIGTALAETFFLDSDTGRARKRKEFDMKRATGIVLMLAALFHCGGCVTSDQAVLQLKERNRELIQQLAERENAIQILKNDKDFLQQELTYYTKRSTVLSKEKRARMSASVDLRQGIREFTDNVMNSLRSYYQKTELVDYIGGELYQRSLLSDESNHLLVDVANPLVADGTLIGGSAYLSAPARLTYCLLRPDVNKPEQYSVIRMSDPIASESRGVQNWTFPVPLAAKKGDLIGVYFPEAVAVPYDDVDTGHVVLIPGPIQPGTLLRLKEPAKRSKRAYSFGVTGFLNQ